MIIRDNVVYDGQSLIPVVYRVKCLEGNDITIDTSNNTSKGNSTPYKGKTLTANNTIYNNVDSRIFVYKSDNVDIVSDTTYNNATGPEQPAEVEAVSSTNIRAYNDITYAHTDKGNSYVSTFKNVVFDHNVAYNGSFTALDDPNKAGLQNIVSQDPQFVNAAGGDFTLKAGSPAIDTGSNSFNSIVSNDYKGNKRWDGDGIKDVYTDAGAYECTGTPTKTSAIVLRSRS